MICCKVTNLTVIQMLTKLRFLWNELNLEVLKYFGRIYKEKRETSTILKAFPESDQVMMH
jgi:hypothetical protein